MQQNGRKIVIIGSGIAGLCAAVYALKCGYQVEILEMNDQSGGLAMSWRRGPYTFETCLHWFLGSKPEGELNALWREVFDIDRLKFIDPEQWVRIETQQGQTLTIYTDVDRMEAELLRRAPQDAAAIRDLTHEIRMLGRFRLPDPSGGITENWWNMLRDAPIMPLLNRLAKVSGEDYARRITDPLLKSFLAGGDMGQMSVIALVFSMAWMNVHNAGYAIGGSQAIIQAIEEEVTALGGTIRFGSKVARILVEDDIAVGVELESGEGVPADWVISAADGHATIFEMLGGRYVDEATQKLYDHAALFPSYAQVSLGIARQLSEEPPMLTLLLDRPLQVDPGTEISHLSFRFFNFDPTFAPPGKTAVTGFLPTRNWRYWSELRKKAPAAYREEKQKLAERVISALETRMPNLREAIEVTDVTTPATVIRHTGNWKGSMEGWLLMPGMGFRALPSTLPGLRRFVMVGQWVLPGGGLPSGPLTARPAIKSICRHDRVAFTPQAQLAGVVAR